MPVRCRLIFHRRETAKHIASQQAAATMNFRRKTTEGILEIVTAHNT